MQAGENDLGTVGFIGLGDMGEGIASNYARHLDLLAFDLRPELEAEVVSWGGRWARDAVQLLELSDIVCVCLVDDRQLRGFIDGAKAFEHMRSGITLVLHSTLSPGMVRELAEDGARHGIEVVDAPVSGARAASVAGTLAVMVGASEATFERLRPLWDAMSSHAFRIGDEPGSGQVAKLCNNVMAMTNELVALEAVKLARAHHVDEAVVVEVARAGSGNSWVIEHWGAIDDLLLNHPQATSDTEFRLLLKDLRTAVRTGAEAGVELAISGLASAEGVRLYAERVADLTGGAGQGRPRPGR